MTDLNGKIAIVTGGASGIGLATTEALLKKGANVVIADYNEDSGKNAEKELKNKGGDVLFVQVNVADEQSVASLVSRTVEKYGRIDILINNAGVGSLGETHEMSDADYKKVVSVNQDGVFYAAKYTIQEMLKTGGGSIVNTASILGTVGQAGAFAYNASKGAVNIMTKSLALEYADKNIRVNAICPGYVESGMVNKKELGDYYDGLVAKHPIGRLGTADEIAHGMIFLCENDFVTGTTLIIDGGYTAQ